MCQLMWASIGNATCIPYVGFHRECYMLFTNKDHIARACRREMAAKDTEGEVCKACQAYLPQCSMDGGSSGNSMQFIG
ncbi:hypothetical protein R3I94_018362 [Phoxinus phoxinus]